MESGGDSSDLAPIERLFRDAWPEGNAAVRAEVLRQLQDTFGSVPTVEIFASAEDEDFHDIRDALRAKSLAHLSLFRLALEKGRRWLAAEMERPRSRMHRYDQDIDGAVVVTPPRRNAPAIAITLDKDPLDDPSAAIKLKQIVQNIAESADGKTDPKISIAKLLEEHGLGAVASINAPSAAFVQALQMHVGRGHLTGQPYFPDNIDRSLFPLWSKFGENDRGGDDHDAVPDVGFPAFLSAHIKWGLACSLVDPPIFHVGDYLNYLQHLLRVAGTNKLRVAIQLDHDLKKMWAVAAGANDASFNLREETRNITTSACEEADGRARRNSNNSRSRSRSRARRHR